jgi:LacI family transcriptional regulator
VPEEITSIPTIVDVAAHAGVSRATASRALSNYGRTSTETVEKVRSSAEALGYRPNVLARSMRAGTTKTIGLVIIADFTNAFFDRVTKSIVDAAKSRGYQVLITNTDDNVAMERQAVETLLEKQVDGIIVVPSLASTHSHLNKRNLAGRPVVLVDRHLDDVKLTSVTTDDLGGSREAVRHALSLGHKRLGFLITAAALTGFTNERPSALISTVRDRCDGFLQGAAEAGVKPRHQKWIYCEDTPSASEQAVAALLHGPHAPTIIFTSNNDMALAVLRIAGNRQLVIGRDLSVVTIDDSLWAAAMTPGLTVVARPVSEVGALAVEKLIAAIENPGQKVEQIVLPTELIARGSVANLKMLPFIDLD